MNRFGFVRVAAAVPVVAIADTKTNTQRICSLIESAVDRKVSLLVFPELCITGSTCGDLFFQRLLQEESWNAVREIEAFCSQLPISVVVSAPLAVEGKVRTCRVIIGGGSIIDIVPEEENRVFDIGGVCFSFEPCANSHIVVIPAADPDDIFKHAELKRDICASSSMDLCAYVYCNAGFGESTTDNAYSGYSAIFESGELLAEGKCFQTDQQLVIADIDVQAIETARDREGYSGEYADAIDIDSVCDTDFTAALYRKINSMPFIPDDEGLARAFDIQVAGLATRMRHINCNKAVIGISGGLDSTLALLCAVRTFDMLGISRKGIIGITMPGFGTSDRTHGNAGRLMEELGISSREIDITAACRQHLEDIGHDGTTQDVTYENAQARERTQILMDVSNSENAIVVGTGDLSELALGWCTYSGDHISSYSVNSSIPKTLVRRMVEYAADTEYSGTATGTILHDIIDTPVSPELTGNGSGRIEQKTEDIIGPYDLHDFFIWNIARNGFSPEKTIFLAEKAFVGKYDRPVIAKWMKLFVSRFFSQQFKRSCAPDGVKVTPVSLSPRGGWDMPSDAGSKLFIDNIG